MDKSQHALKEDDTPKFGPTQQWPSTGPPKRAPSKYAATRYGIVHLYFNHKDNQREYGRVPRNVRVTKTPKLCVGVEEDPGTSSRATYNSHGQPASNAQTMERFIAHQTKTHIETNGRKYIKQTIRLKDKLSYTANPWKWR